MAGEGGALYAVAVGAPKPDARLLDDDADALLRGEAPTFVD